jgi:hypothetical protein
LKAEELGRSSKKTKEINLFFNLLTNDIGGFKADFDDLFFVKVYGKNKEM